MLFCSSLFLFGFLPITLVLYKITPSRAKNYTLLASSIAFYAMTDVSHLWLLLLTVAVNYILCKIGAQYPKSARAMLSLCLIYDISVLFIFKYLGFFGIEVALPVGISFYTFQTLSYVIDVYRGTIMAEKHFGYYALYVSFFPQLVAGPIERPENLLPQLKEEHSFKWTNTIRGLRKMLIGFFKKVVVADLLSVYVNAVYNNPAEATGCGVLIATIMFAFQIYCDFAGYTDIAIGCAEVMGIQLMQNFNRPYISESIQEFWRRWHISLSSWFRDYIYFPLGGSRCKKWRHLLNICIVFFISGLWHGAAWTFVLWGGIHGIYQVIGYFTKTPREKFWRLLHIDPECKGVRYLKKWNTFLLVCFAWMFFRANSFSDLGVLITKLFTDWSFQLTYYTETLNHMGLTTLGIITSILSILVMRQMDVCGLGYGNDKERVIIGRPSGTRYVYVVWTIVLAWLMLVAGDGASSFIYFQF